MEVIDNTFAIDRKTLEQPNRKHFISILLKILLIENFSIKYKPKQYDNQLDSFVLHVFDPLTAHDYRYIDDLCKKHYYSKSITISNTNYYIFTFENLQ